MSNSVFSVLIYSAWTLFLLGGIALLRNYLVLSGKRAANNFTPTGDDVSPFSHKLCRAHANCYENLPVFIGIIAVAILSGNQDITESLALYVVMARIAQSSIHMISTSPAAVVARFIMFFLQNVIIAYWAIQLLCFAIRSKIAA